MLIVVIVPTLKGETVNHTPTCLLTTDVDSTTYKTYVAADALASVMASLYPGQIKAAVFREELPTFYVDGPGGHSNGHDIVKHLREAYELDFQAIRPQIFGGMSRYDLLFDDAVKMFGRALANPDIQPWNVTIGVYDTQLLKLDLLHLELERRLGRSLPPIPYEIREGNKGEYLDHLWTPQIRMGDIEFESGIFVEDHPDQVKAVEPHDNLTIYQVVRGDAKYGPVEGRPDIHQVPDLTLVRI